MMTMIEQTIIEVRAIYTTYDVNSAKLTKFVGWEIDLMTVAGCNPYRINSLKQRNPSTYKILMEEAEKYIVTLLKENFNIEQAGTLLAVDMINHNTLNCVRYRLSNYTTDTVVFWNSKSSSERVYCNPSFLPHL